MLEQMGIAAKAASYKLALLSSREKNRVLETIADELEAQTESILSANIQDVEQARANGLSEAMLDRLALTPARLKAIADDVRQVCNLADPVGQVIDGGLLDSGLRLERRRVPLGVIGVIYEARPNVTVDVASLCLKTGNAAILRGGKETWRTNAATVKVIQQALQECGLPAAAVQAIESPDRALVGEMLNVPAINGVSKILFLTDSTLTVERELEDEVETLSIPLPAVIAVSTDINTPQIPSMKAILGAAKKPVQVWSSADIGLNGAQAYSEQQVAAPKQRERQRVVIEGDGEEQIAAFVENLRKII